MIENFNTYPHSYSNNINFNMRTGTKILVSPKKNIRISEQINMMKEDYRSLKCQTNYEINTRDDLIITYQEQSKKDYYSFRKQINNLEKYYQEQVNILKKRDSENKQKLTEKKSEIDRLNIIIYKKCDLIPLDDIQDFHCPISWDIFKDPVILEDGFTYERENICEWLSKNRTSPSTNQRLYNKRIIPNQILKNIINIHQELLLSLNNCKQQIIDSETQIQTLIGEIESLSIKRDSIQEEINNKKKSRKGCVFRF